MAKAKDEAKAAAKAEPKAAAKAPATANGAAGGKKAKGKASKEAEATGLRALLQKRRQYPVFFYIWVFLCGAIMFLHDPCAVPEAKRQDCGYRGISTTECRVLGCFVKGGKGATKEQVVTVPRKSEQSLGLQIEPDRVEGWFRVVGIDAGGATEEYNAALNSTTPESRIQVGDIISEVDGSRGAKKVPKAVDAKDAKKVKVELQKPRLPPWLMWIRSKSGKPRFIEKVLTAPGTKQIFNSFSYLGGVGLALWALSGFGPASLPVWYGGLAFFTSTFSMRCCHNPETSSGGVPHCYKPITRTGKGVLEGVQSSLMSLKAKISKDPKGYFKKFFI